MFSSYGSANSELFGLLYKNVSFLLFMTDFWVRAGIELAFDSFSFTNLKVLFCCLIMGCIFLHLCVPVHFFLLDNNCGEFYIA